MASWTEDFLSQHLIDLIPCKRQNSLIYLVPKHRDNLVDVSIKDAVHDRVGDDRAHGGKVTSSEHKEESLGRLKLYFLHF